MHRSSSLSPRNQVDDQVNILLATYNGAKYLPEQLQSISDQTHTNWTLHVSDDGSSDNTIDLLHAFAAANPNKLRFISSPSPAGSPKKNFFRLLGHIPPGVRYAALCDQDDFWVPDKLQRLLDACIKVEASETFPVACLVYSDLAVTDEALSVTCNSFMAQIGTRPREVTFAQLLVENSIPGCSTLLNGPLISLVQSFRGPFDDIIMHDWWIALVASGCGRLSFIPQPLLSYRQHESNAAGSVRRAGLKFVLRKLREMPASQYRQTLLQAKVLKQAYLPHLADENAAILEAYCSFDDRDKVERLRACIKHGILKQTFPRRIHQLAYI